MTAVAMAGYLFARERRRRHREQAGQGARSEGLGYVRGRDLKEASYIDFERVLFVRVLAWAAGSTYRTSSEGSVGSPSESDPSRRNQFRARSRIRKRMYHVAVTVHLPSKPGIFFFPIPILSPWPNPSFALSST